MKIKLLALLIITNIALCNNQVEKILTTHMVNLLKNDVESTKDSLMQAILNNDIQKMEEAIKDKDLSSDDGEFHKQTFQVYLDFKKIDLAEIKKHVNEDLSKIDGIYFGQNYLSLAIRCSLLLDSQEEKEKNLKIIESLLSHKANPHSKIGFSRIVEKRDHLRYFTVLEEAVVCNCSIEIFKLLKKYDMKADYVLPKNSIFSDESLKSLAKKLNNNELLAIL